MARVITFSRFFPTHHPKAGEPTYFVEQLLNSLGKVNSPYDLRDDVRAIVNDFFLLDGNHKKHHTIRAGHRWKEGDWFSPRAWSGRPYNSKQIIIASDIQIKRVWNFTLIDHEFDFLTQVNGSFSDLEVIANNDGLSADDFVKWFKLSNKEFDGQIICWNESVNY